MIRTALTAVALAVTFAAPPADAATGEAVVLTGGFSYVQGAGAVNGTGQFWAVGSRTGPVQMSFTAYSPSTTCPLSDEMFGTMTGVVSGSFTMTRNGLLGVLSVSGGDSWIGFAEIDPFYPLLPCGGQSQVTAVIELVGI